MELPAKSGFIVRCNGRGLPNGKTHIWNGFDTCCRMWSTGGLSQKKRWDYYIDPPTELCHNCHAERHLDYVRDELAGLSCDSRCTLVH